MSNETKEQELLRDTLEQAVRNQNNYKTSGFEYLVVTLILSGLTYAGYKSGEKDRDKREENAALLSSDPVTYAQEKGYDVACEAGQVREELIRVRDEAKISLAALDSDPTSLINSINVEEHFILPPEFDLSPNTIDACVEEQLERDAQNLEGLGISTDYQIATGLFGTLTLASALFAGFRYVQYRNWKNRSLDIEKNQAAQDLQAS